MAAETTNLFYEQARREMCGNVLTRSLDTYRTKTETDYRTSWTDRLKRIRSTGGIEHNPGEFVGRVFAVTDADGSRYFVGIFRRIMITPDETGRPGRIGDLSVRIGFDPDDFDKMYEAFCVNEDPQVGDINLDPEIDGFWSPKLRHADEIISRVEAELGLPAIEFE